MCWDIPMKGELDVRTKEPEVPVLQRTLRKKNSRAVGPGEGYGCKSGFGLSMEQKKSVWRCSALCAHQVRGMEGMNLVVVGVYVLQTCCVLACRQRLCARGCMQTQSELGVGMWEVWSAGALGVRAFGQRNTSVFLCDSQETMMQKFPTFLKELEGCAKVLPL